MPAPARTDRLAALRRRLKAHDQAHVLAFWEELDADARRTLLDQIEQIELDRLGELLDDASRPAEAPGALEPAPFYPRVPGDDRAVARFREAGEALLRRGKVALLAVAGGQGTRLGWNGPKGTYPASVVTGKPTFRLLAEQIRAASLRYRAPIPFYIMSSPLNDAVTRSFFEDNNCFGLDRKSVFVFPQRLLPSLDAETGRLLLAEKGEIAMNPDGHGGALRALAVNGALEDMSRRGIEHVSYVQVDNPLVKAIDPLFLGLHVEADDSSAEMTSKIVLKTDPQEKVGVFCRSARSTVIVEYSDLPAELAAQRDAEGQLRFRAGSIAVHAIGVEFLQRLTEGGRLALPLHRALKQVPSVDPDTGSRVEPEKPNAWKLETFVFDALPLAASPVVYETDRVEEFAPIKNARGTDSPETSHRLQSERSARWLEAHGVRVARDRSGAVAARIEIGPLTALDAADLSRAQLPKEIKAGESVVL